MWNRNDGTPEIDLLKEWLEFSKNRVCCNCESAGCEIMFIHGSSTTEFGEASKPSAKAYTDYRRAGYNKISWLCADCAAKYFDVEQGDVDG